ncbi:hypothetical protein DUNSADRAFT_12412 [Dunaliella salina]|uniref:Saposin B-type domain-containing protein n=1 Tax=Dunaliella salina TaxID=3046 RepID=A0ABQ7GBA6_DUNSA|nr:hypothetical protein DUNSADRAFT_12412 [Dunaliella salina]|eukprot:KAF5831901.1 hypothetical protein DUNSADRAFT_12412 [Dunaliella salina]
MQVRNIFGVAVLASLLVGATAQFGGMGGKKEEPKAPAVMSDIPFIKCQVCEKMVKLAIAGTAQLKAKAEEKPGGKLHEDAIIDGLEKMCDPDKEAGEWLTKIDIVEDGEQLKLVEMDEVSNCNTECRTLARACEQIMDNLDLSDMSELLYKGAKRATISNWACYEAGTACRNKPPPVPESRQPGPAFEPMSEDEARNKKLMRTMKEAGLSGQMYDRDSMMQKMQNGGMGDDEDEYGGDYEGEDEDANMGEGGEL